MLIISINFDEFNKSPKVDLILRHEANQGIKSLYQLFSYLYFLSPSPLYLIMSYQFPSPPNISPRFPPLSPLISHYFNPEFGGTTSNASVV